MNKSIVIAGLVFSVLGGSAVSATTIVGNFSGVVTQGTGVNNGIDLSTFVGQSISGSFTWDLSTIGQTISNPPGAIYLGDTIDLTKTLNVTETIGSHTFTFQGNWNSTLYTGLSGADQGVDFLSLDHNFNATWFGITQPSLILLSNFNDPNTIGFSALNPTNFSTNQTVFGPDQTAKFQFRLTSMSVSAVAVPGPTVGAGASSFALAALFFGWLVRRRRHQMV